MSGDWIVGDDPVRDGAVADGVLADFDCTAVGLTGEGRCIEPATVGPLCKHHAEVAE